MLETETLLIALPCITLVLCATTAVWWKLASKRDREIEELKKELTTANDAANRAGFEANTLETRARVAERRFGEIPKLIENFYTAYHKHLRECSYKEQDEQENKQ